LNDKTTHSAFQYTFSIVRLKKNIADLNKEELLAAWQLFKTHFQQNIRLGKRRVMQGKLSTGAICLYSWLYAQPTASL